MDYNVRVQHYFPAASLQTWATPEKNHIHVYGLNLWPLHFRTFCELVEGEENKLTTLSTWTIMLGCNESNIVFQQRLCKLGQLRRKNHIHVYGLNLWLPHFRTFCELVEGEENKLTTLSTWTIMLGCNESNIVFQQRLCKLGQLRRKNHIHVYGLNFWLPHFRTFCELVEGEENKLTTLSTWTIMLGCNYFPAASLQTWATPEEKSHTCIRPKLMAATLSNFL